MNIGERIKNLRLAEKLSQNALAEKAGISQSHLRRVELGLSSITIEHLQLVCDALNTSLGDFFNTQCNNDELSIALSKLTPRQKAKLLDFINTL